MSHRLQVSCVLRRESEDMHSAFEAIGGWASDGSHWWLSPDVAIDGLEHHRWMFYIEAEDGRQVRLVVAEAGGTKYLKAECDEDLPASLLALPECATARTIFENWEKSRVKKAG